MNDLPLSGYFIMDYVYCVYIQVFVASFLIYLSGSITCEFVYHDLTLNQGGRSLLSYII